MIHPIAIKCYGRFYPGEPTYKIVRVAFAPINSTYDFEYYTNANFYFPSNCFDKNIFSVGSNMWFEPVYEISLEEMKKALSSIKKELENV